MIAPRLAPDAAVDQRDHLLDERWMHGWLTQHLALREPERWSCRLVRAKYRIGESVRVRYDLGVGTRRIPIAVRAFPAGASQSVYQGTLAQAQSSDGIPPVIHDPSLEIVAWVFPNDRKISRLATVVAPLRDRDAASAAELVSWVPEKLATARHSDPDGTVRCYVKVFGDQTPLPPLATMQALAGVRDTPLGSMRLPRVLAMDAEQRLLSCEAGPGQPLATLPPRRRGRALRQLGAALATLHATPPPSHLPHHDRLGVSRVARAAELIATARPDVAARANTLARCLRCEVIAPEANVLVHGDVHARNVLCAGETITLIDLDQVALGPAAADLASVLAALACERISGAASASQATRLGRALCEGYALVAPLPDPTTLAWHVRAAMLVERCLRAVNRVRTDDLTHLPAYLDQALRSTGGRLDV